MTSSMTAFGLKVVVVVVGVVDWPAVAEGPSEEEGFELAKDSKDRTKTRVVNMLMFFILMILTP